MNGRRTIRIGGCLALLLGILISTSCASAPRPGTYTRLLITGAEIRAAKYRTAYEALTHHRELIMLEGEIGFKGGDESAFGRGAQEYFKPMLVVNGNFNLNDAVTTLRRIPAENILAIRLYRSSMVPPKYRIRSESRNGVIEVNTR